MVALVSAGTNAVAAGVNNAIIEVNLLESAQFISSTTSSGSISTIAAILTIPSCVFKAGYAYSVKHMGGLLGSTTLEADVSFWKTSTAGTQIGASYRYPAVAGGAIRNCDGEITLRNATGADVTFDLVLAVSASTGTVTHEAAANRPRVLRVMPIGLASVHTYALAVT